MDKVFLILENGMVFPGDPIGFWNENSADPRAIGELVFTTGMTGYLETLTDPSYAGQIVIQTFPMIGNYGLIPEDFEGDCFIHGYVVRELCRSPSNFRSEGSLDRFLLAQGVPGICGVDTRALTRILREHGVMNACLSRTEQTDLSVVQSNRIEKAVSRVSTAGKQSFFPESFSESFSGPDGSGLKHVVLIDYGAKRNIVRNLIRRGCRVTLVPHDTAAEEILDLHPDGLMLSNGPGDPAENVYEVSQIRKLIGQIPIFGICLGHQLCALALGGRTYKLKYGHRGANQPVTDGKRTWITTQNHGYAVDSDSMRGIANLSYWNANDQSCEGLEYPALNCFTVQFHPEACAGPHDTEFLFDRFLNMIGEENGNAERQKHP